ncbi:MAG TPA: hypothetical protein VM935_13450, partial [Chitinophagaceae bacterium]|nr:hypothetical protein [Chitinophagaceae bacterium]
MATTPELYEQYKAKMHRIADLKHAQAVLQWDQETYLPPKGADKRGQQLSTLSELTHQLFVEEELGNQLQELSQRHDLPEDERKNIELTLEDYTKNKKYSSRFVRDLSMQINKAYHAWIEARQKNSFSMYEKDLHALVELKKEEADILGYSEHPYNAHLNEFEKGCTVALLDGIFPDLIS